MEEGRGSGVVMEESRGTGVIMDDAPTRVDVKAVVGAKGDDSKPWGNGVDGDVIAGDMIAMDDEDGVAIIAGEGKAFGTLP